MYLHSLKLFNQTIEESISGLETLVELIANWDSIDDPDFKASKIFVEMKRSLNSVLDENNRIKYDQHGNIVEQITARQAFVQFFNELPFASMVNNNRVSHRPTQSQHLTQRSTPHTQ